MTKLPSKHAIEREIEAGGKAIIPAARELISALTLGTSDRFIDGAKALDEIKRIYKASKLECLYEELINEGLSEEEFSAFCDASDFNNCNVAVLMQKAIDTADSRTHLVLMGRAIRAHVKSEIPIERATEYLKTIADLRRTQIVAIHFFHQGTHLAIVGSKGRDGPAQYIRETPPRPITCLHIYGVQELAERYFNEKAQESQRQYKNESKYYIQFNRNDLISTGLVESNKRNLAGNYTLLFTEYGFKICECIRFSALDITEFMR